MSRLFTFGCSFTATEHYPSWSAFLGLEFKHYENWGVSGIGCKAIAERVAECHSKNKFTKESLNPRDRTVRTLFNISNNKPVASSSD